MRVCAPCTCGCLQRPEDKIRVGADLKGAGVGLGTEPRSFANGLPST